MLQSADLLAIETYIINTKLREAEMGNLRNLIKEEFKRFIFSNLNSTNFMITDFNMKDRAELKPIGDTIVELNEFMKAIDYIYDDYIWADFGTDEDTLSLEREKGEIILQIYIPADIKILFELCRDHGNVFDFHYEDMVLFRNQKEINDLQKQIAKVHDKLNAKITEGAGNV